jgi:hypothetical protein
MRRVISIVLIGFALAACAPIIVPAPTSAPLTEPPAQILLITVTAPVPTALPPVIPATNTPASEAVDPVCVPVQAGLPFIKPAAFSDFPAAIGAFLNAGGSVDVLAPQLGSVDYAIGARAADFNGDGKLDVIAAVRVDQQPTGMGPAKTASILFQSGPAFTAFLIFQCNNGVYDLAQTIAPESNPYRDLRIYEAQDMNNDGKAEALISFQSCGASTCFENLQIIAWNGGAYVNALSGTTEDLPYPTFEWKFDNGLMSLSETGGSYGSVGAGPTRAHVRNWQYDAASGFWQIVSEKTLPSNYRIHVLLDADAAFEQGNAAEAIPLYRRVIDDMTLSDWADPRSEQINLAAYARFRLIVAYTALDQPDQAAQVLSELQAGIAPDAPEHVFVDMALIYLENKNCAPVQSYIDEHNVISLLFFGYANPTYTAQELCP